MLESNRLILKKKKVIVKVYIETYGCTMNQADTDILRGVVAQKYRLVDTAENADVVLINSCGVVEFTERKILKRILVLKKSGKIVIVAGCLPRISLKKIEKVADGALSPDNILKANEVIEKVLKVRNR